MEKLNKDCQFNHTYDWTVKDICNIGTLAVSARSETSSTRCLYHEKF